MNTTLCPECHHENGGRMIRCLYCGAGLAQPAARENRACPRCTTGLEAFPSTWVAIDLCKGCGGQFFDRGELDRAAKLEDRAVKWLAENLLSRPSDGPSGKQLKCPGCAKLMRAFALMSSKDLLIDICPGCKGTWLDKDEAGKIRRAIEDGLGPVTSVLPPVGHVGSVHLRHHTGHSHGTVSDGVAGTITGFALELGLELVIDTLIDGLFDS